MRVLTAISMAVLPIEVAERPITRRSRLSIRIKLASCQQLRRIERERSREANEPFDVDQLNELRALLHDASEARRGRRIRGYEGRAFEATHRGHALCKDSDDHLARVGQRAMHDRHTATEPPRATVT